MSTSKYVLYLILNLLMIYITEANFTFEITFFKQVEHHLVLLDLQCLICLSAEVGLLLAMKLRQHFQILQALKLNFPLPFHPRS